MFGLFGKQPQRNPKAWLLSADPKQLNQAIAQLATHQMMNGQEPDPWALLGSLSDDELWQCVGQITKSSGYKHPMMQSFLLPENGEIASMFAVNGDRGEVELIDAELDPAIAALPATQETKYFDWSNVHSHAHTAIIGATGAGKSHLSTWLASQLQGDRLVADIHYKRGDWSGLYVVGAGRNFNEIAHVLQSCLDEMDRRYQLRLEGQDNFTNLTLIIEEIGSIAEDPASADICKEFLPKTLREARKVNIKLILLGHGLEVESLGVKGKGSIRNCLNTIRLGDFAIAHAKSLKDDAVIDAVARMDRPCMVDRLPALIPDLSNFTLPPSDRVKPGFLSGGGSNGDRKSDYQPSPPAPQSSRQATIINTVVDTPRVVNCLETSEQLSEPLKRLVQYVHKKQNWVTARDIQSGIRLFRDSNADEIRDYFRWLVEVKNIGELSTDGNEYRCICPE
jgi:hypothetical protein